MQNIFEQHRTPFVGF